MQNKKRQRELCDSIKISNNNIIGTSEEEIKEGRKLNLKK